MRNFCEACESILLEPFEFRYGLCMWCFANRLEKLDVAVTDYWFGDEHYDPEQRD